jgi:hypothetical protein
MDSSNDFREEREELPPFLRQMKGREEGFRVPPGYFEALPGGASFRPPVRRAWLVRHRPLWVAAASFTLLLMSAAAYWHWKQPLTQPAIPPALAYLSLEEIQAEEIQAYIVDNISDFEGALTAALPAGQVTASEAVPSESLPAAEELEDYLLSRMEDLETSDLEALLD